MGVNDKTDQRNSGRGGGGGSRACFKCGLEGHMARECPAPDEAYMKANPKKGGAGGPRVCWKCG